MTQTTQPTSGPQPASPAALRTASDRLAEAVALLTEWHDRQATGQRTYVSAGHECIAAIDATLRALYDARSALVTEIRTDEDERAERVDAMLARFRADRKQAADGCPRVIPAGQWRPGLEYAVTATGKALTHLEQLGGDVRWSPGVPAWALADRPLVVRCGSSR